ncbi:CotO family spore coat protein [Cytobacillus massiliigabonensis]|uniref:CotO family spore coat protein n=1 Tax=Cytobacillus massiliigabonensis TaxID=1871011 RepID=UPI0015E0AF84|nr:CotO family spore coat protein [Cytobacillus massiliigabonensis]
MTKRKEKEPLFYIQQPTFQFPSIKMQETYSSKRAELLKRAQMNETIETNTKQETEEEKLSGTSQKEAHEELNKTDLFQQEKLQDTLEEFETDRRKQEENTAFPFRTERKHSFQRVKSFKEMSIMERLQYLMEFPKQLPPVPCLFIANGNTIKGFLNNQLNEFVEIKLLNGETMKISLKELEDIKMIGLRR